MKFGIVISTYKRSDGKTPLYLERLLKTIFHQSYKDFKVYIIGDKYEDNKEFLRILSMFPKEKMYVENLPSAVEREKYKNNPLRLWCSGGTNATNHGINKAVEEGLNYICCPDHDDYWLRNHLQVIEKVIRVTNSPWLCTRSKYGPDRILPSVPVGVLGIEEFLPQASSLIKSSVCMDFVKIPLRFRDFYEQMGGDKPGDADLWDRCRQYLLCVNYKSYLIDAVTCVHDEEGYVLRGGENEI